MNIDLYGLFGVAPNASPEELRRAFLRIAKTCHPDTTLNLEKSQRDIAEKKFRDAQRAYEILNDPERRKLYDEILLADIGSPTSQAPTEEPKPKSQANSSTNKPPNNQKRNASGTGSVCEICGGTPAAKLLLKRNVGLLIARRSHTLEATLCAPCAQRVTRNFQIQGLTKGWFGAVSIPVNIWNLAANATRSSAHKQKVGNTKGASSNAQNRQRSHRPEPGWLPDPSGRFTLRYFNAGGKWERLCKDADGKEIRDHQTDPSKLPTPGAPPPPRTPPPPPRHKPSPGSGSNGSGWFPDPTGKFALRYFNAGGKWERLCKYSDGKEVRDFYTDPSKLPPPGTQPPPPRPPRPKPSPGEGANGAGWYPDPTGKYALRYFNARGNWEKLCKDSNGKEVPDFHTNPSKLPPPKY
jgi:curved DNA-binding protein CbpA